MKKIYVRWNPLHERVVCVHTNENDSCSKCDKERLSIERTAYSLQGDWFEVDESKSNNLDRQYTSLLQDILTNGTKKGDRTGTGTISVFGRQIRHKMSDGFPLITTKKMAWKGIVTELLWFLRGDTNIKFLVDNDCHIWDGDAYKAFEKTYYKEIFNRETGSHNRLMSKEEFILNIKTDNEFAKKWGSLGKIYGAQWRHWSAGIKPGHFGNPDCEIFIDQMANLIRDLNKNPDSRRIMVNAWNVAEIDQAVLPPCHYGFQVYTRELGFEERMNLITNEEDVKIVVAYCENPSDSWLLSQVGMALDKNNIPTRAISLMWNQRSVDTFLGLPFNIASYGLLLEILAKEVNMVPDELIGNLGDTHLYLNHIEQAEEQIGKEMTVEERTHYWFHNNKPNRDVVDSFDLLTREEKRVFLNDIDVPTRTREPFPLPTVKISDSYKFSSVSPHMMDTIEHEHITLENYQSHPTIKAPLSN